jgi:hypothetical protein
MQDETREYPENDPGQAETGGERGLCNALKQALKRQSRGSVEIAALAECRHFAAARSD